MFAKSSALNRVCSVLFALVIALGLVPSMAFADEVTPQSDAVTPQAVEVSPQTDEVTPQTDEVTPQTDEVTPQSDAVTPQAVEVSPQTDEVTPQATQELTATTWLELCDAIDQANNDTANAYEITIVGTLQADGTQTAAYNGGSYGGWIYIHDGANVTLKGDGEIVGFDTSAFPQNDLIGVVRATLTIDGITIRDHYAHNGVLFNNGELIHGNYATINLKSGTAQDLKGDGPCAFVEAVDSFVNMYDGYTVKDCHSLGTSGWATAFNIYAYNDTDLTAFNMYGGRVTGCVSDSSGGAMGLRYCNVNIMGGSIDHNKALVDGGVVYYGYADEVQFVMSGGSITDNEATESSYGGLIISNPNGYGTKATISGGIITGNKTALNSGGLGVVYEGTELTITGGTIENNTADEKGGGVYVQAGATCNIAGGTIQNNTAGTDGGGVDINNGIVNMSGGTIQNNSATGNGSGIFLGPTADATLNLSDAPLIDKSNDVYLTDLDHAINVTGPFTGATTANPIQITPSDQIHVSTDNNVHGNQVVNYYDSASAAAADVNKLFVPSNKTTGLNIIQDDVTSEPTNYLILAIRPVLTFNTNGGTEIGPLLLVPNTVLESSDKYNLIANTSTKDGWSFDGWYTDAALTTPVTATTVMNDTGMTLYAKWTTAPVIDAKDSTVKSGGEALTDDEIKTLTQLSGLDSSGTAIDPADITIDSASAAALNAAKQAGTAGSYPITYTFTDPDTGATATKTVTVTLTAPKLEVTLSTDKDTVGPGESVTYTIDVTNTGNGVSENGEVTFVIPEGLEVVDLGGGTLSPDKKTIVYKFDPLDPGAHSVFRPVLKSPDNASSVFSAETEAYISSIGGVPLDPSSYIHSNKVSVKVQPQQATKISTVAKTADTTPWQGIVGIFGAAVAAAVLVLVGRKNAKRI